MARNKHPKPKSKPVVLEFYVASSDVEDNWRCEVAGRELLKEVNELYGWCHHCERVFDIPTWNAWEQCPAGDCQGTYLDLWPWSEIRGANPSYPLEPVNGALYPLYGSD